MTITEAVLGALLVALAGAGHCLGMCGSISVSLGFALPRSRRRGLGLLVWHGLFASGRVGTYAVLGALAGGFGQALRLALPGGGRPVLAAAALLMLFTALALLGRDPGLQRVERLGMGLWRRIQPRLRPLIPVRHPWQALLLGMAWGLLPCGLVYTALLMAATTGSPVTGALSMLAFGLVTLVPVTGTGLVAGSMPWLRNGLWRRLGGGLGLLFAGWLLYQALAGHAAHQGTDPVPAHPPVPGAPHGKHGGHAHPPPP